MAGPTAWTKAFWHPEGHGLTNFKRVKQWLVFSRQWRILDAKWQDPEKLAEHIAGYLKGLHKPIYHPFSDCGDHVVVYNCRHIAMKGFDWKRREYYFYNRRMKGHVWYPAWEIHRHQPTRILWMAVYLALDKNMLRRNLIERLHLFPDEDVPPEVSVNVSDQIRQAMKPPKRYEDYTDDQIKQFPSVVDFEEEISDDDLTVAHVRAFDEMEKESE